MDKAPLSVRDYALRYIKRSKVPGFSLGDEFGAALKRCGYFSIAIVVDGVELYPVGCLKLAIRNLYDPRGITWTYSQLEARFASLTEDARCLQLPANRLMIFSTTRRLTAQGAGKLGVTRFPEKTDAYFAYMGARIGLGGTNAHDEVEGLNMEWEMVQNWIAGYERARGRWFAKHPQGSVS